MGLLPYETRIFFVVVAACCEDASLCCACLHGGRVVQQTYERSKLDVDNSGHLLGYTMQWFSAVSFALTTSRRCTLSLAAPWAGEPSSDSLTIQVRDS